MTKLIHRHERFVARFAREDQGLPAGCALDVEPGGAAVLIIDGERLFHFETLLALLEHYAPGPSCAQ